MLKNFVCGRISVQIVLKHPPWHGDSKNVLRFEIGWWEGSYFWTQTNGQGALLYRYCTRVMLSNQP